MSAHYFIGLEIHKKMIAYCVKTSIPSRKATKYYLKGAV